jgi:hypothetical protein
LSGWLRENALDNVDREIVADALALELICTFEDRSSGYPWDAVGATLALRALEVFEDGSYARLPKVEPTIDDRLREMSSRFTRRPDTVLDITQLDYIRSGRSYAVGAISAGTWNTVRRMWERKYLHAKGNVRQAIGLAEFGDMMLAAGFNDPSLDRLREILEGASSDFAALRAALDGIRYETGEYNATRFARGLELSGEARHILENPARPVRYYDLIAWILESPLLPRRNDLENDDAYATAIYLAGAYAGSVYKSAGR